MGNEKLTYSRILKTIFVGGMVVGVFDGLDAVIYYPWIAHVPAAILFQNIAAGVLGPKSFTYGTYTIALGVALHFFISFCVFIAYYLVARKFRMLIQKPLLWGSIYGIGVYLFMQYVVIPLSLIPKTNRSGHSLGQIVNELIAHVFLVGIPSAWIAKRSTYID